MSQNTMQRINRKSLNRVPVSFLTNHPTGPTKADSSRQPSQANGAATAAPTVPCNSNNALQFVNLTDTAVLGASARKLVRSHVMKEYERHSAIMRGSEPPRPTARPMKNLQKDVQIWNAGPLANSSETRARDKKRGISLRMAHSATSSTSPRSTGLGQSLEDGHFESGVDANGGWEAIDYTIVQGSNQPTTWDPGDADSSGFSSTLQAGYRASNDREAEGYDALESLQLPSVSLFGVANTRIDPFETLPFSTPRSEILLSHCKHNAALFQF